MGESCPTLRGIFEINYNIKIKILFVSLTKILNLFYVIPIKY